MFKSKRIKFKNRKGRCFVDKVHFVLSSEVIKLRGEVDRFEIDVDKELDVSGIDAERFIVQAFPVAI